MVGLRVGRVCALASLASQPLPPLIPSHVKGLAAEGAVSLLSSRSSHSESCGIGVTED